MIHIPRMALLAAALGALTHSAWAGRPLASDDAGTADAGTSASSRAGSNGPAAMGRW